MVRACIKSADSQNLDLSKACYGLLFFGVPNHGLRSEQLKSIVQGQPNEALIRDLTVDDDSEPSTFLKRISDQFAECCRGRYQVISFFERQPSPTVQVRYAARLVKGKLLILIFQLQPDGILTKTGPKIYMVTEKSAISTGLTATADDDNIPFNTDHSELIKYQSSSQLEYSIVKAKLKNLVDQAKREVGKRFTEKGM